MFFGNVEAHFGTLEEEDWPFLKSDLVPTSTNWHLLSFAQHQLWLLWTNALQCELGQNLLESAFTTCDIISVGQIFALTVVYNSFYKYKCFLWLVIPRIISPSSR